MHQQKIGYLYLFIGIFLWATIELTIKLIQTNSSPISITFFRMVFGGLSLLGYIFFTKKSDSLKYFFRIYWRYYIPGSILGLVIGLILYTYGTAMTQASLAATIMSANPIVIATYMMYFQKEPRSLKKIFGIILGFLGVIIIITELNFQVLFQTEYIIGNIIVFIGMLFWCIDIILGNLLLRKKIGPIIQEYPVTNIDYNTVTFLFAAIIMIPCLWIPGEWEIITNFTPETWILILYLGIVTSGLGYICFFKGLAMMNASSGINAFYFKPIIATLLSVLILTEIPTISLYIGIIIEIIAIYFVSEKGKIKT